MPGGDVTLIGDLGKPAEALINRISDAVGGIARPYQIKRVAKAEAEAEVQAAIITAEGQQKLSELQERALTRLAHEEAKKQENIESISHLALPLLSEDAAPENLDEDWLAGFFDQARNVSNEQIQLVWAKILAVEANKPESIPQSTVSILRDLGARDAKRFEALLGLSKQIGDFRVPVVSNAQDEIVLGQGLDFDQLSHLDDLGLVTFGSLGGFNLTFETSEAMMMLGRKRVKLTFKDKTLPVGMVRLSFAGRQIAECLDAEPAIGLDKYLQEYWTSKGVKITEFNDLLADFKFSLSNSDNGGDWPPFQSGAKSPLSDR